jgi:streptogramin lyase
MRALACLCLVGLALAAGTLAATPTAPSAKIDAALGPCAAVDALGSLWVTSYALGELVRISPETNKVTGMVRLGAEPCGISYGGGSIWINAYGTNAVERVDPRRLRVVKRIPVSAAPWDVVYAADAL